MSRRYHQEDFVPLGSDCQDYTGKDHCWAIAEALRLRQLGETGTSDAPDDPVFGWDQTSDGGDLDDLNLNPREEELFPPPSQDDDFDYAAHDHITLAPAVEAVVPVATFSTSAGYDGNVDYGTF